MSVQICSINSGSNGNCYYVGNETDAVLIDAGISCRETLKRMKRVGLSMEKVRAIFISHEHSDHIRGLEGISARFQIPVYFTSATYSNSGLRIHEERLNYFTSGDTIEVNGIRIEAFSKIHDAIDPHSFIVRIGQCSVGVITDIGRVCENVEHAVKNCEALILESNYDETMLRTGKYPWFLKQRISGGEGHISNDQALALYRSHCSEKLQLLILSHLSRENNHPDIVDKLFSSNCDSARIVVASRYQESEVFTFSSTGLLQSPLPASADSPSQLSLFSAEQKY